MLKSFRTRLEEGFNYAVSENMSSHVHKNRVRSRRSRQRRDTPESHIFNCTTFGIKRRDVPEKCSRSFFFNVATLRLNIVTLQRAVFSSFSQCRDVVIQSHDIAERINSYFL